MFSKKKCSSEMLTGGQIPFREIVDWVDELVRTEGASLQPSAYVKEEGESAKSGGGGGGGRFKIPGKVDPTSDAGEFSRENVMRAVRARVQARNKKVVNRSATNTDLRVIETYESIALMAADNFLMAAYKVWQSWPEKERIKKNEAVEIAIIEQNRLMFSSDRDFGVDKDTENFLKRQEEGLGRALASSSQSREAAESAVEEVRIRLTREFDEAMQVKRIEMEQISERESKLIAELLIAKQQVVKFEQQEGLLEAARRNVEALQGSLEAQQATFRALKESSRSISAAFEEEKQRTKSLLSSQSAVKQESEAQLKNIFAKYETLMKEKNSLLQKNAASDTRILILTEQLQELPESQRRVEEIKQQLLSSTATNTQFSEKMRTLQSTLAFEQEALTLCKRETLAEKAKVKDLERSLALAEEKFIQFREKLEEETRLIRTKLREEAEAIRQRANEEKTMTEANFSSVLEKLRGEKEQMSAQAASAAVELSTLPLLQGKVETCESEVARLSMMLDLSHRASSEVVREKDELQRQLDVVRRALSTAKDLNEAMKERLLSMERYNRNLIGSLLSVRKWISTDTPEELSTVPMSTKLDILGFLDSSFGTKFTAPTPEEHVKRLLEYIGALKEEIGHVLPQDETLLQYLSGDPESRSQTLQTLQVQANARPPKRQINTFFANDYPTVGVFKSAKEGGGNF